MSTFIPLLMCTLPQRSSDASLLAVAGSAE